MKIKFHYAWIIVFVTFLTLLAVQGVRLSFGAFVEPWETEISMDRGTISLISTLSFIIYGLSQPIIGRLVDKLENGFGNTSLTIFNNYFLLKRQNSINVKCESCNLIL